jgi:hypothetical protein
MKKLIIAAAAATTTLTAAATTTTLSEYTLIKTQNNTTVADATVVTVASAATVAVASTTVTVGVAANTPLWGEKTAKTSLAGKNGKGLALVTVANIKVKGVKLGRQALETPLINGHHLREVETSFEGVTYAYEDVSVGLITESSGFAAKNNGFEKLPGGKLAYIYASFPKGKLQVLKDKKETLAYADVSISEIKIKAAAGSSGGRMIGIKKTFKKGKIGASLSTTLISGKIKAVEGCIGQGSQQGCTSEGAAYGGSLNYGGFKVSAVQTAKYDEYFVDYKRTLLKENLSLRLRFSQKEGKEGKVVSTDTRLMLDYKF